MHYYKRNLGDYAKKAGRLSMLQHGSYTLLIDACYDREQFPTMDEAIEWTWASTTEEMEAVQFVLRKFFILENGVYVQTRIQEELAEYRLKAETNKRIATERETNRKAKGTNRSPVVNEPPPNHKPITNNHKPILKTGGTPESGSNSSPPADAGHAQSRTQIDPEFKPDEPNRRVAVSHDLDVESERGRFIAHFTATGDWRANWQAQFRKWILDSMQRRAESAKRQGAPPGIRRNRHDERADTIAELTGRNRRHEHESGTIIDITPTTNDVG